MVIPPVTSFDAVVVVEGVVVVVVVMVVVLAAVLVVAVFLFACAIACASSGKPRSNKVKHTLIACANMSRLVPDTLLKYFCADFLQVFVTSNTSNRRYPSYKDCIILLRKLERSKGHLHLPSGKGQGRTFLGKAASQDG